MASRNQVNPPPLRTISDFKSKLTGGGARANLFEVVLTFPDAAQPAQDVLDKSRFLVKGARLPASNIAQIEVPFRGGYLKLQVTEPSIHGQSQLSTIQTSQSGLHSRTG